MTVTTPPNRIYLNFTRSTRRHSDVQELRGFGPRHQTHYPRNDLNNLNSKLYSVPQMLFSK